jgi:HK97 family phage prohead protease
MLKRKSLSLVDCQLKFDSKADAGVMEGYATVFDGVDSYGDTIVKGAYERTLAESKHMPYLNFAHRDDRPMGKILEIKEDDRGLWFRSEFTPGNTDAQNIRASVVHGAVHGLSIEFRPYPGGATPKDDNSGGYTLTAIKLRGIAIVPYPADDDARVTDAKSELDALTTFRDCEQYLRDAGFSKSEAAHFVSQFKSISRRDAGDPDEITKLREKIAAYERAAIAAEFARNQSIIEGYLK